MLLAACTVLGTAWGQPGDSLHPPPETQAGRRDGEHHVLEMESWVAAAGSAPVGLFDVCWLQSPGKELTVDLWDTESLSGTTEGSWGGVFGGR